MASTTDRHTLGALVVGNAAHTPSHVEQDGILLLQPGNQTNTLERDRIPDCSHQRPTLCELIERTVMLLEVGRDDLQVLVEQLLLLRTMFAQIVLAYLRQLVGIGHPSHLHEVQSGLERIAECIIKVLT